MSVSVTSMTSVLSNQAVALKSSKTEAPSAEAVPTPSAIVSISAESRKDDDARTQDAEYLERPGATLQMSSPMAQAENRIRARQKFAIEPRQSANSSLRTANAELVRLQDRIAENRASILGKTWDFVLKDNKIEVVNDNLSAKDRQWLENFMNKNQKLLSSVQNFYGAVTKFYDHTSENTAATGRNTTGTEYNGYAFEAESQINGKLAIRDIMDKSLAFLVKSSNSMSPDIKNPFQNSVLLAASYLKFEAEPKFQGLKYDLSDPGTAKYFKDNPNEHY